MSLSVAAPLGSFLCLLICRRSWVLVVIRLAHFLRVRPRDRLLTLPNELPTDEMKPRRSNTSTNDDIFLDYWITKSELANILGVARSTLLIWENIAFWRVEAFRQAYPSKEDGDSDRSSPLSPYQAWVLGRVGRTMQRLQRQTRVKDYIDRNPCDFSKNRYQSAQQQVSKLGA